MDFLYKLYSNNYFGIGLFIVITILAFAFLIILFFGKKDEKARMAQVKLEEEKEDKIPIIDENEEKETKVESLETIPLESKPIESQEIDTESRSSDIPTSDLLMENLPLEEKTEASVDTYKAEDLDLDFGQEFKETAEKSPIEEPKEDRDLDIFSINPDLDMNDYFESEPITYQNDYEVYQEEPIKETYDYRVDENNIEQNLEENTYQEEPDVEPLREMTKKPTPSVFSSVYKNNEREDIFTEANNQAEESTPLPIEPETYELKEEPFFEEPKEEKAEEVKPIVPKKPEFVMPKRAELPKLNKNTENNNDSIIKF